jgi:ABC-type branched-subunit amino acid transport system substrate-binding protein
MGTRRRVGLLMAGVVLFSLIVPTSVASAAKPKNSDPQEGVTPTSITVGGVEVASGEGGFTEAGQAIGAKAYFNQVNAAGGVFGRKINFIGAQDDGYSATSDVSIVQNLVEQKHVFAVVPVATNNFTGGSYLVQNNVPFIGSGNGTPYCGTQSGFGFLGCAVPNLAPGSPVTPAIGKTIEAVLKQRGELTKGVKPSIAMTFNSSGSGPAAAPPLVAEMKAAGFKVSAAMTTIPAQGTADYSPYAQQIMTSNNGKPPSSVFLVNAGTVIVGLKEALVAAGYKGPVFDATTYSPQTTQNPQLVQALQGEYSILQVQPAEANFPAVKQMLKAMRNVAGASYVPDIYAEEGYESAAMLVDMLKATGPNLTRGTMLTKVNSGFNFEIPNLFGEIPWPESHAQPVGCDAAVQLKGKQWKVVQDLECYANIPIPPA